MRFWRSLDRIRRGRGPQWTLGLTSLWIGLGLAFGPPSITSTKTYTVVRAFPGDVDMRVWGTAFLISAVVIAVDPLMGYASGVGLYAFFGGCISITVVTGQITGWPAPAVYLCVAAGHYFALKGTGPRGHATQAEG